MFSTPTGRRGGATGVLVALAVAATLSAAYLVWEPASADLAAQVFRSDLFADHGFLVWNNDWYAGHYLPGYSLLFPPLGAALGPRLVGALAVVAAAALFAAIAQARFGRDAWLGSVWFAVAAVTNLLLTGRITFALGVAVGLGALLALQRRRPWVAAILAVLTTLASPVAGLFAVIAGAAVALAERHSLRPRRAWLGGAAVAIGAGAAVGALALAFPTAGSEPFVFSAFVAMPLFAVAALVLLPPRAAALRLGVVLYLVATLIAVAVDNPVGGNITRLGALFAGPVMALVLWPRRPLALALIALPLLWWQLAAPVRDLVDATGDPSTERAFYEPLLGALADRAGTDAIRIEIPPTRNRWESAYVAPEFPLARGWLRQLETDDLDLFSDGELTAGSYRRWLAERGVSYVAVADADLDYLADDEADLIDAGLPYLRRVWSDADWSLYRVEGGPGLVSDTAEPGRPSRSARLVEVGPDRFTLEAARRGDYLVRIHDNRYWRVESGDACVAADGDWVRVEARSPGRIAVAAPFTLAGLFGAESRCSG
jgi:hypothetical protein